MKKYSVLIIGAGRIGATFDTPDEEKILTHAHAFRCFNQFSIVGFADHDMGKAQAASNIWGGKPFSSIDEVDVNVDIAVICTPDHCHYEDMLAVQKLCPKLVVLEKPVAETYKEAVQIRNIYSGNGIPVIVNYSRRFSPYFHKLKEDIYTGAYGDFLRGNGYYGKGIMHNGSHMVDIISYLFGDIIGFEVFDVIEDFTCKDKSVSAVIALKNDKSFTIQAIDSRVVTVFEIDLFFKKKRIHIGNAEMKAVEYRVQASPIFEGYKNYIEFQRIGTGEDKCLQNLGKNVLDVLQRKANPLSSMEDACNVIKICEEMALTSSDRRS